MTPKIEVFDFEEQPVRVHLDENGVPWFHAGDVCRVLGIENSRDAVARLDDDEKDGVGITDTTGREQRMIVINEPGLYRLTSTSRKPEARAFMRLVFHEVLPAIRRHGAYAIDGGDDDHAAATVLLDERRQWVVEIGLCRRLFGIAEARWLWRQSPLPQPPDTDADVLGPEPPLAAFVEDTMEEAAGAVVPVSEICRRFVRETGNSDLDPSRAGKLLRAAGHQTRRVLFHRTPTNPRRQLRCVIGWRWKPAAAAEPA